MSSFGSRNDFADRSAPDAAPKPPAACPVCRSSSITTTSKSPNAESYWRCAGCGEIWNVSRRDTGRRGAGAWR